MAMAALNQSSPALTISMDVPRTQNTAPVLEFRCLFTPDLRRKQKRWQDGRLKFHTFNKRVMVYDDRSNFVGDTHWRKDYEFDEGEELQLERGGILIEVGECIGKRDQDLTELVDKRVKDREERVAAKNAASPRGPQASLNRPQTPAGSALLRPKSLNAVLGNSMGHYGKALITTQSPFEQRQQSIRDENDNGRPAKRRKQDDTPPSRNGYSQNLMGTKLTLATSKPPSTATIRYEPLRSSIQRPPAATIDLTGGEEDKSTTVPSEERTATKPQRQRPKKSPSARSGYASNLTGASLNLKGPDSYAAKRSANGLSAGTSRFKTYQTQETDSSSSVEPDSVVDAEPSPELPAKRVQKPSEPAKKRTKPTLPTKELLSRSSSPPVRNQPAILSKLSKAPKSTVTQDSQASRLVAEHAVSTLRIKSRAPRKMMMLMERPISRSSVPTESLENSQKGSRRQQNPKPVQNVVLSQTTMRLNTFREQQERRLQERLNVTRLKSSSDDLPSFPADTGIDHRMIDALLSRRTKPAERPVSEDPVGIQEPGPALDLDRDREDEEATRAGRPDPPAPSYDAPIPRVATLLTAPKRPPPEPNTQNAGQSNVEEEGPSKYPRVPKLQPTIPSTDATASTTPTQPEPHTTEIVTTPSIKKLGVAPVSPEAGQDQQAETVRDSNTSPGRGDPEKRASNTVQKLPQSHSRSSKTGRGTSPNSPAPEVHEPRPDINSSDTAIVIANAISAVPDTEPRIPVASVAAGSKVASLPAHIDSAIISATTHFRALIKSSASPSVQAIQDLPSAALEEDALPSAPVHELQKFEPTSSDFVIKASPKPSPPMMLGCDLQALDLESTTGLNSTSNHTVPTVPNARIEQPKARLANPATRGPSVQMTANRTVNAPVPAFNGLPSIVTPPPRILSRTGKIPAQDEASASRSVRGPVKEVTPGGPWSRESFDLFGTWRPPGSDTGTNTVNG